MHPVPTIETERLILRPHALADFDAYAAMWAEPEVVRFIGGVPFGREQSWTRFLRQAGMWQVMGFGFFALEEKDTGRFLGEAGLHEVRREMTPPIEGTLEAGWALVAAGQGRGLAEEAMRAVLGWGDAAFPGRQVSCIIQPENRASLHVAEKLGFRPVTLGRYHGAPTIVLYRNRDETSFQIETAGRIMAENREVLSDLAK